VNNAVRDALALALRIVAGLVPERWQAVVMIVSNAIAAADWGDEDIRWGELARLVTELLRDIEAARGLEGVDLTLAARAAAEVRYTRALREQGLLEVTW
jgi:hypothetical protein